MCWADEKESLTPPCDPPLPCCNLTLPEDAELAEETAKYPAIGVTLPGLTSKEVYEVTVSVTNKSNVCSNMGEGGEDLDCPYEIHDGTLPRSKIK